MLAKILFVGVQHGTDNFGQELFHLLRGAASEIFGAQLGLDLLAGQTECRVSFHAGNHIIGLALLLDHSGSGHAPAAAEPLSEEEHAERELILRRADAATCGAFAAADASCGCCALAEIALRTAYGAGFRQGDVWLIADDAEVFARYGGRSSKVPLCGLSPEGTGRGGVRGLFLHRMRVGSKSDVKRLRKGGRRIVVWDVNSAGDAAAMRAYGVDFIVTDDPESIGGR